VAGLALFSGRDRVLIGMERSVCQSSGLGRGINLVLWYKGGRGKDLEMSLKISGS